MDTTCRFEEAIVAAARSGTWHDELRTHRDGCPSCAEATLVAAALAAEAALEATDPAPLPEPRVIWLKARLAERERRSRRATLAITWVQRAAVLVAVVAGALGAPSTLAPLRTLAGRLLGDLSLPAPPLTLAGPAAVLVATFATLALGALWNSVADRP